jgi:hypothetical protein
MGGPAACIDADEEKRGERMVRHLIQWPNLEGEGRASGSVRHIMWHGRGRGPTLIGAWTQWRWRLSGSVMGTGAGGSGWEIARGPAPWKKGNRLGERRKEWPAAKKKIKVFLFLI